MMQPMAMSSGGEAELPPRPASAAMMTSRPSAIYRRLHGMRETQIVSSSNCLRLGQPSSHGVRMLMS